MKQIDRYVVRGFLIRFVVSHLIVFGLYVSFDALKRIDQLRGASVGQTLPRVLAFYAYQFPTGVLDTVPPLLLLAAGLTLVQMSRNGELLTLKASGVSLRRVTLPIFVCAVPLAAGVFWARDNVVPWAVKKQELLERELDRETAGPFLLDDSQTGARVFVGTYDYATHTMSRVCVMELYPGGGLKMVIEADSGRWMEEGSLYLEAVTVEQFDTKGGPVGKPTAFPTKQIQTGLSPYDFVRARQDVMTARVLAMTSSELRAKISRDPRNPRLRVMFQSRLAASLAPFVLLLLGIPLLIGFEQSTQSRVLGAFVCILVTAGFHVLSFVSISMGNTGLLHPVVAAWLPPVLAGGVGSWLFGIMQT